MPCNRLRFGGVYPGKFLLANIFAARYSLRDCPFVVTSFEEARFHLNGLSLQDLIFEIEHTIRHLSVADEIHFDQNHFVMDYFDRAGRMAYLEALWDAHVITMLRVPLLYNHDDALRKWLLAFEGTMMMAKKPADEPALTDTAPESAAAAAVIVLTNPRWKHAVEQKAKDTPDVAAPGDKVTLMADVKGLAEGAAVTFTVYDSQKRTGRKIDSAAGKNQGGVASAGWTVKLPQSADDIDALEFDAAARDARSPLGAIAIAPPFSVLLEIDVDDPAAKDDELILYDDKNTEVMRVQVGGMKEVSENVVRLVFHGLDMKKKYTLIRDYGAEEHGGHDPLFVNLTPEELMGVG